MPYCPSCGCEYRQGFARCSDCGTDLVDRLPEEASSEDGEPEWFRPKDFDQLEPVCVLIVPSRMNGEVVLSALRSAGVRTYMAGTGLEYWSEAGGIGQITRAPGPLNEVRIMVHPDDEDEARDIVRAAAHEDGSEYVGLTGPEAEDSLEAAVADRAWTRPRWRVDPRRRRWVVRGLAAWYLVPFAIALVFLLATAFRVFFG